jgi:aspartate/methionine/tyrosine aminotransferase
MTRFPPNDIISLVGGAPRYDLAESIGPDLRLADLLGESGAADLLDTRLGYGTAQGEPRLRQAIADVYDVNSGDVVVTVGGVHALFLLAFTLCDRGDEALIVAPLFPQARNTLQAAGANVYDFSVNFDGRYQPDLNKLSQRLSARTRLVSLASPQNPSGVAIPLQTLAEMLALMREKCPDAYLLVDETYREAVYGDEPVRPSAVSLGTKVICVASLSKCHGAPGLRLGWAIVRDPTLREQLIMGKFNTVISCASLDETLGLRALQQRERILQDRRRLLAGGLRTTEDWISENSELVEWVRPDAGAICCVRLKRSVFEESSVKRFHAALAAQGVRVAEGSWFGDEQRVFRLGFGLLPMPEFQTALGHLSSVLRKIARE